MLGVKAAGLIAILSIAVLVATSQWPQRPYGGDTDRPANARTNVTAHLPAVLTPMPADDALDCRVEAERTFVPRRKAFVMKKAIVCR